MAVPVAAAVAKAAAVAAASKKGSGKKWLIAALVAFIAVPALGVMGPAVAISAVTAAMPGWAGLGGGLCQTPGSSVDAASVPAGPIAGYEGEQLVVAAIIMNKAAEMGLSREAQQVGVMTAMGESSLQNLDHGDAVDNTTIGVFQQGESYGPRSARLDPPTAAGAFFTRLIGVAGWETLQPTLAAHEVQINADPNHYAPFWEPAGEVVTALEGSGAGENPCAVSGDAVAVAKELMTFVDSGALYGTQPDHIFEIRMIANGGVDQNGQSAPANCGIDLRILQVLLITVRHFGSVGVSDINRQCTGQSGLGAGTASSHWINGGGQAIDFFAFGGKSATGADPKSLELIALLDPIMPAGSRIGQSDCRADAGVTMNTANFTQFPDSCDHVHLDVAFAKGPVATR